MPNLITIRHFCMTSGRHPSYSSSLLFLLYNFLTINIAAGNILSTLICQTDVSYFISLHDLILYVVTRYYHNILLFEDYKFIFSKFKHIFISALALNIYYPIYILYTICTFIIDCICGYTVFHCSGLIFLD